MTAVSAPSSRWAYGEGVIKPLKARRPPPEGLPPGEATALAGLVDYAPGAVVSRTLVKRPTGTVTLFAFARGQELSEHTAPFDALVQVLDGTGEFTVGGHRVAAAAGEAVLLPANVPHAVRAPAAFKMLLTMIRGG